MTAAVAVPVERGKHRARGARPRLRLDIEGLRAVAVGLVVLYHAGVEAVPGGFVGVDVFFVISGYLITSLLLRELAEDGSVSLVRFYARRARRLLPAATLVLLVTAAAAWWLMPGSQRENLAVDVAGSATWSVNWVLAARSVDYLAEGDLPSPLQHYWSLAIEEQYYVVWPLLIVVATVLTRRIGRHRNAPGGSGAQLVVLALVAGVLAVSSLLWSVDFTGSDPTRAYFVSTTRFWELGLGTLLAVAAARAPRLPFATASALGIVGLLMITVSALVFTSATPWPGAAALVPTLGACAVIAAGWRDADDHPTPAARLLAVAPMVWVGGLSYAIYLWHWPLLVLADVRWPDLALTTRLLIGGLLAVVLAWLTKHGVEDRARFHPRLTAPRQSLALGAALVTAALGVAGMVWQSVPTAAAGFRAAGAQALVADPRADRWTLVDEPERFFDVDGPVTPRPALAPEDAPLTNGCQVAPRSPDMRTDCTYGDVSATTTVAMLGDSKMGQWFPALRRVAERENWQLDVHVKSACAFTLRDETDDCVAHSAAVLEWFRTNGAPDIVILSQGNSDDGLVTGVLQTLTELQSMGSQVVLLADSPASPIEAIYDCVEEGSTSYLDCSYKRTPRRVMGGGTPTLAEAARRLDVPLMDLNQWICPPGAETCPPVVAHTLVYRQGTHVTATYIKTLTPMLHRALVEAGVARTPLDQIRLTRR